MYTYKSHEKSSNRAFDHLYDVSFNSNRRIIQKMNHTALLNTAPIHIIPCYNNMFSESRPSHFYLPQRNILPIDTSNCTNNKLKKCLSTPHFFSIQSVSNAISNFGSFRMSSKVPPKLPAKREVKCQTVYREADVQTVPYLPHPKLRLNESHLPEVLCVDNLEQGPYLEDIQKIERNRMRKEWENKLRETPISVDEKISQLKIIEWESFLHHEKELNKKQEERYEYVKKSIELRKQKSEADCHEKLLKIYQKSSQEKLQKMEKLEEKAKRFLRKLKFGTELKVQKPIKKLTRTKSTDFIPDFEINENDNLSFIQTRKALWIPKQKTKEFEHAMKSEKTLSELHRLIRFYRHSDDPIEIRCRKLRASNWSKCENYQSIEYPDYEKEILILKSLKGNAIQKTLQAGLNENIKKIRTFRKNFPMHCVVEILGEENFLPQEEEFEDPIPETNSMESIKLEEPVSNSPPKQQFSSEQINELENFISKIIECATKIIEDMKNRKILNEANTERLKRQEITKIGKICQEIIEMCRDAAIDKSEKNHKEAVNKIMEAIVPYAIDMIAEKEALAFVMHDTTEQTDSKGFNLDGVDFSKIEKFLNEHVLPHIQSKSQENDDN